MMRLLGPVEDKKDIKQLASSPPRVKLPTDYNNTRSGCRGKRISGDLDDQLDKFFGIYDGTKLLTEAGKQMFYSSGGPRGQWVQRSFKFTHQYFELMDKALSDYGVDPSTVKFMSSESGKIEYEEYKRKENGIFTHSEENRLWNWDSDEDGQELLFVHD